MKKTKIIIFCIFLFFSFLIFLNIPPVSPATYNSTTGWIEVNGTGNTLHTIFTTVNNVSAFSNLSDATTPCHYASTTSINITGDLIIDSCTLEMNSSFVGEFIIRDNGHMLINYSNITALDLDTKFSFEIYNTTNITNSYLYGLISLKLVRNANHSIIFNNTIKEAREGIRGGNFQMEFINITNNVIKVVSIGSESGFGIFFGYVANDFTIIGNTITTIVGGIYPGFSDGINLLRGVDSTMSYNTIVVNDSAGISTFGAVGGTSPRNVTISYNTILVNGSKGIYLTADGSIASNNIIIVNITSGDALRVESDDSLIENNVITLYGIDTNAYGIAIKAVNSEHNRFVLNTITSDVGGIKSNSPHQLFKDMNITANFYDIVLGIHARNNTFLNVTDKSNESVSGNGELIRQWYLNISVNSTIDSALTGFNLSMINITGSEVEAISNSAVSNIWFNITEYTNTGGTRVYETPHNITISKKGYRRNSTIIVNITKQDGGSFDLVVTLQNDSVKPEVSISFPVNNTAYLYSSLDLNFTATDNYDLEACWYQKDQGGTNITILDCTTNLSGANAIGWAIADHNITLGANDTAGNYAIESFVNFTVTTDTTPPTITIDSPSNGSSISVEIPHSLNVKAIYSDNNDALSCLNCSYNHLASNGDRQATNTSFTCSQNFTVLATYHGLHRIYIWANDTTSNEQEYFYWVTLNAPTDGGGGGGPPPEEPEIIIIIQAYCGNEICESYSAEHPNWNETIVNCPQDCKPLKELKKGNLAAFPKAILWGVPILLMFVALVPGKKIKKRLKKERRETYKTKEKKQKWRKRK